MGVTIPCISLVFLSIHPQVCVQSLPAMDKKMTLLTFVKDQVAVDPGKLQKFIQVLCRRPPMAEVVARLEGTYRKFLDGGVLW